MKTCALSFFLLLIVLSACSEDEAPNNLVVTYESNLAGEYAAEARMTEPAGQVSYNCPDSIWYGSVKFVAEHQVGIDTVGVYRIYSVNANGDTVEDPVMGAYYQCFASTNTNPSSLPNGSNGEGSLRLNDRDGLLFWTGVSRWGETYFLEEVNVSGAVLFLKFQNDYNEGFEIRLIREDGTVWPEELHVN